MENLIIPKDKLPWYKDADATRIAVGVGYLVVLVSIMVFVMLTWRDVPDDAKAVILPIVGAITGAAVTLHTIDNAQIGAGTIAANGAVQVPKYPKANTIILIKYNGAYVGAGKTP